MHYRQIQWVRLLGVAALLLVAGLAIYAQKDPGVRQGAPGAGAPLKGLSPIELSMFSEGLSRALQLEGVCDGCSDIILGSPTDPAKGNLVTQTNSQAWVCALTAISAPHATTSQCWAPEVSWSRIPKTLRASTASRKTPCST